MLDKTPEKIGTQTPVQVRKYTNSRNESAAVVARKTSRTWFVYCRTDVYSHGKPVM